MAARERKSKKKKKERKKRKEKRGRKREAKLRLENQAISIRKSLTRREIQASVIRTKNARGV